MSKFEIKENSFGSFTLIIDGNWWLQSRMFSCDATFLLDELDIDEGTFVDEKIEKDRKILLNKLVTDLSLELKRLPCIDEVIFVTDSKSWRKDYTYLPKYYEDFVKGEEGSNDYKANRLDKKQTKDFKEAFKVFYEYLDILSKNKVITHIKSDGLEGDDIIFILTKYLRTVLGKNNMFLSTDQDLIQCVDGDYKTGAMTIYYNKKISGTGKYAVRKNRSFQNNVLTYMINTISHSDVANSSDYNMFDFDMNSSNGDNHVKTIKNYFDDVEEIDLPLFLLNKCLIGDDGDNVHPIFYKLTAPVTELNNLNNLKLVRELTDKENKKILSLEKKLEGKDREKRFKLSERVINEVFDEIKVNKSGGFRLTQNHLYDDNFIKGLLQRLYIRFNSLDKLPQDILKLKNKIYDNPTDEKLIKKLDKLEKSLEKYKPFVMDSQMLDFYMSKYIENRKLMMLNFKEIPKDYVGKLIKFLKNDFVLESKAGNESFDVNNIINKHKMLEYFGVDSNDRMFQMINDGMNQGAKSYSEVNTNAIITPINAENTEVKSISDNSVDDILSGLLE